jgi:hypothetical protein
MRILSSFSRVDVSRFGRAQRMLRSTGLVALALLMGVNLSGCGSARNPDREAAEALPEDQKLGGFKFEILSGSQLSLRAGKLEGDGQIRVASPMIKVNSGHNFYFKFRIEDGGELRVQTFARTDLSGGVELILRRPVGAEQISVALMVGTEERDYTALLPRFAANDVHELWWDVHNNDGDQMHTVLWNEAQGDELLEDLVPMQGVGVQWGVRLRSASLLGLDRQEVRDRHE